MAIATFLGILCGLFFGDLCSIFAPLGQAYIMLLKATAIPYLIVAIIHGIGQLSSFQAKQILKKGIFFITATPNNLCLPYFNKPSKFHLNNLRHIYHFNHINLGSFFLKNNFLNTQIVFQYLETPYKNLNSNYIDMKKLQKKTPSHPGNMMTLAFKKMK